MMKVKLAKRKLNVMAVLEESEGNFVVASLDELSNESTQGEKVSAETIDILPLLLTRCRPKEYRVDGSDIDDNPNVELYLMCIGNNKYDIVRRHKGRADAVLTDGALSMGQVCNVIEACRVIDWQCDVACTRDVETVCVSNAVAIVDALEA